MANFVKVASLPRQAAQATRSAGAGEHPLLANSPRLLAQRQLIDRTFGAYGARVVASRQVVQRVPFAGCETNNTADNDKLFLLYRDCDIDQLYRLHRQILQEDPATRDVANSTLHLREIIRLINLMQMQAIPGASAAQGNTMVSGNLVLDDTQLLGWAPIVGAGPTPDPNAFPLDKAIPEYRISQNDAEGKTLTYLFYLIRQNLARISHADELTINIKGTNGPCNGCKDRTDAFVERVEAALREVHVLGKPLAIRVRVEYMNAPRRKNRGSGGNRPPVRTLYGWTGDQQESLDDLEPVEAFTHTSVRVLQP
ncbi:hypothetical protein [Roseateles depolymerans]|uniref:Uncharacterized protein n=1 Tax=Roseateles depolymerans TaxID=76731 RepID=A0A0U3LI30_9BURK|nr:hypothetical protein [Roseateles depolymerans]ALV07743.1 hypothetical protein RD2015_3285 [Roseateles depolymerans]REG22034.1 hypothetical protein DES44_1175 [Roseateles depolymerans]